ncbi:MAG: DNA replication/repair protein RecF [Parachlamydiaceae bacterium]|nr:DNA replication/repair protein RecF [Parachlamydiaceae bacterium]
MHLKSLYLHNFRLYTEAFFEFCPDINMICGRNAAGKTSLIEAINFLTSGHSFRTHQLSNLIRNGASYFHLEAYFVKHGIEQRLKITHSNKERKIVLNNTRYPSSSSLVGLLLSVVFSPNDLEIIKGAPQGRRQFLDTQLAQINPLYLYHCTRYNRAMRQRNCLLKAKNLSSIYSWECEMALSAAYLLQERLKLLKELQPMSTIFYQDIANEIDSLSLSYRSSCKSITGSATALRDHYLEQYEKNRVREMAMACSLIGPHKDDLAISLGDKEVRFFASEGQMRSCAAALRLAEWKWLEQMSGEKPLMLLDDVTTSLDQIRSSKLFEQFDLLGQLFLTTTEPPLYKTNGKEQKLIAL